MEYTNLGETDLKVSKIGFGGGQLKYNSEVSKPDFIRTLRHAYRSGVNLFDTSPFYESESLFGEGLSVFDRHSFVLNTKVGRYPNDHFDYSAKSVERSVQHSLQQLQTSYIDVIQVHDFEFGGEAAVDVVISETLPTLQKLKDRGLVRYIGLGSYHLPKIKDLIERSPVKIDTVLNHSCLTIIDHQLADYMPFFKERGVGVINAAALAHYLLSSQPLQDWVLPCDELKAASHEAIEMAQQSGFIIERLAMGYAMKKGDELGVDTLLSGSESISILEENIDIRMNGLNDAEEKMCETLKDKFFAKLPQEKRNWILNTIVK